jgi:hypothetical protein
MRDAARQEVARVVSEQPGRLRRASANTVLALLAASALTPVAVEVLGGGSVVSAVADIAGNVGSGYLTDIVTAVAARLRGRGSADAGEVSDLLTAEFRSALEKNDAAADDLRFSLVALVSQIGGLEAATDELRHHLLSCFEELQSQARRHAAEAEERDRRVHAAQRRNTRQLERQNRQLQEMIDWLRLLARAPGPATDRPSPSIVSPLVVPGVGRPRERPEVTWEGGAEVTIGDRVYLLHDVLLAERTHDDGTVSRRARALRTVPSTGPDRYVWLRQVQARPAAPEGHRALAALERERNLLSRLGAPQPGAPRVGHYVAEGHTATLALAWPASRSHGPSRILAPDDPPRMFSLLGGLAGLCDTLARLHALRATHRLLTPEGILVHDDGRLSLLDLGLAGHEHTPGEGPADYQAPEQRRRSTDRPGPYTDVYQLAAVAYHLMTGRPPHPRTPLPVRGQAEGVPEPAGTAVDSGLVSDPGARPTVQSLGAALRAARDQL